MYLETSIDSTGKKGNNDEPHQKNHHYASFSLLCAASNIVVYCATTKTQFIWLGWYRQYLFHVFLLWTSVASFIVSLATGWLGCMSVLTQHDLVTRLFRVSVVISLMTMTVGLILSYVQIGNIWYRDPTHSIFYYRDYWSEPFYCSAEGAKQYPILCTSLPISLNTTINLNDPSTMVLRPWAFIFSTVVVRLFAFQLMILPLLIAILACCGGCSILTYKIFQ